MSRAKIKNGKAEVIQSYDNCIKLIKFNGRYYTVFGKRFAVAGNHVDTQWEDVFKIKHYGFTDWDNMTGMYIIE